MSGRARTALHAWGLNKLDGSRWFGRLAWLLERRTAAVHDEERFAKVHGLSVDDDLRDQRTIDRTAHFIAQAQRLDVPEHAAGLETVAC